ncbi:MAG: hypothetical protein K8R11_08840, partial [Methanococcoides sp.]|nr:hypothetical protein [Methanococcoides sp.]
MIENENILNDLATEGSYRSLDGSIITLDILKSIFDDIPLIMILVDHEGKIENINKTATIALEN